MIRKVIAALASASLVLVLSAPAEAQRGIALEIRGGLNYPVGDFSDDGGIEAESLAGYGADLIIPVAPRFSLYGGLARETFDCALCDGSDELLSTGFDAGVKFLLPWEARILPWLKGGLIYHKAEFRVGPVEAESDWGLGVQVAAGADIPLGQVLSFSPAIRYQTYTAEFETGLDFVEVESDVSFLSLDLGMHIHFGGI